MNQQAALGIPMIMVGDFNADSASNVMQFLQEQSAITYNGTTTINNPIALDDSWYIVNPSVQKPGTVVGSGGIPNKAIDWILVSPNTNVISATIDNSGVNGLGDYPSDHLPVVITFDLSLSSAPMIKQNNQLAIKTFPNPFEKQVYFEFELPEPSIVALMIMDIKGAIVKETNLKQYPIGQQKLRLDMFQVPEGLYFYQFGYANKTKYGLLKR